MVEALTLLAAITGIVAVVFAWPTFEAWLESRRLRGIQTTPEETVLARVQRTKMITVGCIVATPWFMHDESDGKYSGIYASLFDDICERNGLKPVYISVRNDVTIQQLQAGKLDAVASLLHTPERAKRADFPSFHHNVALIAVGRKQHPKISVLGDLKNPAVKCAVVRGEIGAEVARNYYMMTPENDRLIEVSTADVPSIFYQVANGTVDVTITTGARWLEFQRRAPDAAAKLEKLFSKPLLLVPAGCMIKSGEREWATWLDSEFEISRAKPDIKKREQELLADFQDAIEAI